jgi:hypothetical protein
MTISVKQAKSGRWYAVNMHWRVTRARCGRPTWFPTEVEARTAVDQLADGNCDWVWIAANQDAA